MGLFFSFSIAVDIHKIYNHFMWFCWAKLHHRWNFVYLLARKEKLHDKSFQQIICNSLPTHVKFVCQMPKTFLTYFFVPASCFCFQHLDNEMAISIFHKYYLYQNMANSCSSRLTRTFSKTIYGSCVSYRCVVS